MTKMPWNPGEPELDLLVQVVTHLYEGRSMMEEELCILGLEGKRRTAIIEYCRLIKSSRSSLEEWPTSCIEGLCASIKIKIENIKNKINEGEGGAEKKKMREMRLSLYMQRNDKLSEIKRLDEEMNKHKKRFKALEKSRHSLEEKLFPALRKMRLTRPYQSILAGDDFRLIYYMCLYGGKSVLFAIGRDAQRNEEQVELLRARFEADFVDARWSETVRRNGMEAGKLYRVEPVVEENRRKMKKVKVSVDVVESVRWAEYGFCGSDESNV